LLATTLKTIRLTPSGHLGHVARQGFRHEQEIAIVAFVGSWWATPANECTWTRSPFVAVKPLHPEMPAHCARLVRHGKSRFPAS